MPIYLAVMFKRGYQLRIIHNKESKMYLFHTKVILSVKDKIEAKKKVQMLNCNLESYGFEEEKYYSGN